MRYLLFLIFCWSSAQATVIYQFDNPAQKARFNQLTSELRCLVCQNQNLAESNAKLAVDLREQIYQQLQQGRDKQDIRAYMVKRYGDFILYRPVLQSKTFLLWFGPIIILAIGFAMLIKIIKRAT